MLCRTNLIKIAFSSLLLALLIHLFSEDTISSRDFLGATRVAGDFYADDLLLKKESRIEELLNIDTLENNPDILFQEIRKVYSVVRRCNEQNKFHLKLDTGNNLLLKNGVALLSFPKADNHYGLIYVVDIDSYKIKSIIKGRELNPVKKGISLEGSIRVGQLGSSLASYENQILIGSPVYSDLEDTSLGSVSLLNLDSNQEIYRFKNPGNISQRFGSSVKINQDYITIYAAKDDPFRSKASVFTYSLQAKEKIFEVDVHDLIKVDLHDDKVIIIDRTAPDSFYGKIRKLLNFSQENQQLIRIFTLEKEKAYVVNEIVVDGDSDVSVENGYLIFTYADRSASPEKMVGYAVDVHSRENLHRLYSSNSQNILKNSQFSFCLPKGLVELKTNN